MKDRLFFLVIRYDSGLTYLRLSHFQSIEYTYARGTSFVPKLILNTRDVLLDGFCAAN